MEKNVALLYRFEILKMEKRLFLLDAFALIFRAYYALIRNPRITSKGKNTNAQFGFTNALVDLINKQKPSHMAICFDTAAPTERHTDFADYKANRQEAPEDLLASIPDIKKIIEIQLNGLKKNVLESDIELNFTSYAIDYLAEHGFDPQFGARPLKRLIQKEIVNQLSKKILAGDIDKTKPVTIDVFDGVVVFRNDKKEAAV